MNSSSQGDVTRLLLAWSDGDAAAFDQLVPHVYQELRRLARHYMSQERAGHPLQPTALVNEAYLRLIDVNRVQWQNRSHFFAIAAQMMRRVLIEFARSRNRQKRGADAQQVSLDRASELSAQQCSGLIALNDALSALSIIDQRMSQVVELRFFGGLTVNETSKVLNISPETVLREWKTAKVWLLRELSR